MNELSAQKIEIGMMSFPEVLDGRKIVGMKADDESYLQLTAKTNPMAHVIVNQLERDFGGVKAIVGMGFDYNASLEHDRLILYPDTRVSGIWVKVPDFKEVKMLFNR